MLQRTTLITSLLLALGGTAHAATDPVGPVDVAVRYTTTVCATPSPLDRLPSVAPPERG